MSTIEASMAELVSRLEAIERSLEGRNALGATTRSDTAMQRAPALGTELDPLIARLSAVLAAIEQSPTIGQDPRVIDAARQRFPEPLQRELSRWVEILRHDERREREWWLLGMAPVIERIGFPSNILDNQNVQRWEYFDASGDLVLTVVFTDGIVTRLSF